MEVRSIDCASASLNAQYTVSTTGRSGRRTSPKCVVLQEATAYHALGQAGKLRVVAEATPEGLLVETGVRHQVQRGHGPVADPGDHLEDPRLITRLDPRQRAVR